MPKLQQLVCPNCGAKLRWNGAVTVVECRYCETHVAVETGGRTDRPTDVVSIPPSRMGVIVATSSIVVIGIVLSVFLARRNAPAGDGGHPGPAITSTVAQVTATPLAATKQVVARHHHVSIAGKGVSVAIADGPFATMQLLWDDVHPDHISSISLAPRVETDPLVEVIARAQRLLGRRLRKNQGGSYNFLGAGASLSIGRGVQLIVHPAADPRWKERFESLWSVVAFAAFEAPLRGDAQTRHDLLDLGIPLARLGEIPLETGVDAAAAAVKKVAPNDEVDGARHRLMIDHPWFESATLGWSNEAGGTWTMLVLYFPTEISMTSIATPLLACLRPVVGEPQKTEADHLAGTFTLQYRAKGGAPWIDIGPQTVQIYPHYSFGQRVTPKGLADVIAALAACR